MPAVMKGVLGALLFLVGIFAVTVIVVRAYETSDSFR